MYLSKCHLIAQKANTIILKLNLLGEDNRNSLSFYSVALSSTVASTHCNDIFMSLNFIAIMSRKKVSLNLQKWWKE